MLNYKVNYEGYCAHSDPNDKTTDPEVSLDPIACGSETVDVAEDSLEVEGGLVLEFVIRSWIDSKALVSSHSI